MKKVTVMAAVVMAAMNVNAQARFGVQAGVNFASTQVEQYNQVTRITEEKNTSSNTGATFGFLADLPIVETLSFMPELNYVQKGYEFQNTTGGIVAKEKAKFHYVEVPLNFVVKADVGMGKFFFGLGPSVGFGLSGTQERSLTGAGNGFDFNRKIDVDFDGEADAPAEQAHYKRMDLGANALAGYMFSNGLFFKVNYTYGFRNLYPDNTAPNDKDTFKTRGLSLKLGYMLGGNNNDND